MLPWNIKFWCQEHANVYLNENGFLSFLKDQGGRTARNGVFPFANAIRSVPLL